MIKEGSKVTLHYTGTLKDGSVFDSSIEGEPLQITVGEGMLIPGFEKQLHGMKVGEKKTFTVAKEDAYPYQDELIVKMPRVSVPKEMNLQTGATLVLRAPNGQRVAGTVVAVDEQIVTVDLNPPVAGKDLTFAIEIVKVE